MIGFALLVLASSTHSTLWYRPSPLQLRVDRSFSITPIDTPLIAARLRLTEQRTGTCTDECEWVDRDKVRYLFWGDTPNRQFLVAKTIRAADFLWKPIPALGIGQARDRALVMNAVQRFAPRAEFDCLEPSGTDTPGISCSASIDPGWVTVDFDVDGKLVQVRLDGYHRQ